MSVQQGIPLSGRRTHRLLRNALLQLLLLPRTLTVQVGIRRPHGMFKEI